MRDERIARLEAIVREAIEKPKARNALYGCMKRGRDKRSERLETLPGGASFRAEVKAIKERCIGDQEALVARFIANAEARGARVYCAQDGAAAIARVIEIARAHGYSRISKSKSLTTEEIELNEDLIRDGLQVIETDLGELIIQLAGEKPYHLVFPSVHKMREDVAALFARETGQEVSADIDAIMKVVRAYLRPIFLNTDIGLTGGNVAIAENGVIVIETNEGNARLVSSIGKCHIAIIGIEKIVESVEDALMMVLAHPVSAVGQLPTTYVTWMGGRNPLGDGGGPRATHIILLDNGRRRMREDARMREALHCIRCGACMNICPTYGVVGGHAFGYIYPGPIGIPWTAETHGLDKAAAFADLCISCGLCKEICPAQIDMPFMIAEVKQRAMAQHVVPRVNRVMMAAEGLAKLGSVFAPLANASLRNPLFRAVLEKAAGLDRRRALPPFAWRTLRGRFRAHVRRGRREGRSPVHGAPQVAFFHDIYYQYNAPELGMRAIRALESAGCAVVLPPQRACGYPYIAYGDLAAAQDVALENLRLLRPYVEAGCAVVAPEPTAAYCLKVFYPKLLPHHPHVKQTAAQSYEFFEYLLERVSGDGSRPLRGRRLGFHCACHQRPLGNGDAAMGWLRRLGAEVLRIETGTCCGMAGTFGLKHGPLGYDLANAVGEPLFALFREAGVDTIVTESSVCRIQLAEGTGLPVCHPLELL